MCVSPQHSNFEITDSGFFINPQYPTLGASPDGIISCDCHGIRTLEIKCPYCSRDCTPETAVECSKISFLERDDNGDGFKLKEDTAYYYQVQAQLNICDVQYGDFVVWTPHGINVERLLPQQEFFESAVKKIEDFYKQAIMPELLGKWYTKKPVMPSEVDAATSSTAQDNCNTTSEELWCYCKKPEDDRQMIGCDYPGCTIQWFHVDCLQLKAVP